LEGSDFSRKISPSLERKIARARPNLETLIFTAFSTNFVRKTVYTWIAQTTKLQIHMFAILFPTTKMPPLQIFSRIFCGKIKQNKKVLACAVCSLKLG
jgi:hypothetical protein